MSSSAEEKQRHKHRSSNGIKKPKGVSYDEDSHTNRSGRPGTAMRLRVAVRGRRQGVGRSCGGEDHHRLHGIPRGADRLLGPDGPVYERGSGCHGRGAPRHEPHDRRCSRAEGLGGQRNQPGCRRDYHRGHRQSGLRRIPGQGGGERDPRCRRRHGDRPSPHQRPGPDRQPGLGPRPGTVHRGYHGNGHGHHPGRNFGAPDRGRSQRRGQAGSGG